jgi:hypothetical protein
MILWFYLWEKHSWCLGARATSELINAATSRFKLDVHSKDVPMIYYGMSCISDREKKFYSDCGDSMLRNFFIKIYRKLLRFQGMSISQNLLEYLDFICSNPSIADTIWARFDWTNIVSRLNKETDKFKIKYLLPEGKNAFYAIDVGLDNILRVIGKLLGEPEGFDMEMKDKASCIKNLEWICKQLNKSNRIFEDPWEFRIIYNGEETAELTGFVVEFRKGSERFELNIDKQHFDFNKPFSHSAPYMDEGELDRSVIGSIDGLLAQDMRSVDEKIVALFQMSMAHKYCGINLIQYFIKRWIDTSGSNFYEWKNPEVNHEVAKILLITMSEKENAELNIPALVTALVESCNKQAAVDSSEPAKCERSTKPAKRTVLKDDDEPIERSPNFLRLM